MFFVELCLTFGSVSSVGLFDRGARVMVWLAVLLSGFQWWLCVQHLGQFAIAQVRVTAGSIYVLYKLEL